MCFTIANTREKPNVKFGYKLVRLDRGGVLRSLIYHYAWTEGVHYKDKGPTKKLQVDGGWSAAHGIYVFLEEEAAIRQRDNERIFLSRTEADRLVIIKVRLSDEHFLHSGLGPFNVGRYTVATYSQVELRAEDQEEVEFYNSYEYVY